ncbi:hypothetical protein AAEU28_12065 [Pseudoalteromonas sp. SS15]|uniref:hypothetical protein n=1 Tax=Pseudoalteromonas sp. SS15 TaxID=3139393 RepID=UPI003BADAE7E
MRRLSTNQGSLFEKIINKDYSKVSGHVIRNIIKVCKEKPRSFEFLKSELIHQEDTFLKPLILLNGELRKNVMFQNLRVMPYRIFLCSNYSFQDSNVCNIDIDISLDINMPNKVTSNNDLLFSGNVCNRKWFAGFIIGYLNLFIQQVKSAGYAGSLFIHSVNSASVKNYFSCQKDPNRTHGIESAFKQLIELGEMSNSKSRGGLIGNRLAIELPFDGAASKSASGEVLL